MAGSSSFHRTTDPNPGFEETNENVMIQIAISYENNNGNAHIRLYRNGDMFGDYTKGPLVSWPKGDAEVFWGIRHGNANNGGPDNMDAHIEESRIYARVLTSKELKELRPVNESKDGNYFQLRIGRVKDCLTWSISELNSFEMAIKSSIKFAINNQCFDCFFDVTDGDFSCFDSSSSVVYRARVDNSILPLIGNWVEEGSAYILYNRRRYRIDNSYPAAESRR